MGEITTAFWGDWCIRVNMFCLGVWTYQASYDAYMNTAPYKPYVNYGTVTASDSKGLPALPIESEQAAAFEGALEAGASRTGVYVFRLNEERSPSLLLNVQAGFSPNALQFELK